MDSNIDKALLIVISHISKHFGPKAVLKGGMALRLQGIDRSTMDADYTFQPSKSKKEFSDELIDVLNEITDEKVAYTFDSKKIQLPRLKKINLR